MDALLNPAAARYPCASVEDLQLQLTDLLNTKVSPTKAEHITVTFEIQSNAVFHINESDTSEVGQNLDPSLGGLPVLPPGQTTRDIVANDTLMNQPQDSPTLQKVVSKHIITVLGTTDQSSWTVRQVSRTSSGWTFTYICKDSTQAWARQNAKNKDRPVVGISSAKDDQDPVNISRPAFDCRGSVTIAFVRSTRTINVRYDHTPFHRTVAQLLDYYAPPPPPAPVPKRQADAGADTSAKKKRKKSQAADGDPSAEGTPSKRKKKDSNATAAPGADPAAPLELTNLVPGLTLASEDLPSSTPTKTNPEAKKPRTSRKSGAGRKSSSGNSEAPIEGSSTDPSTEQASAGQSTQPGSAPGSSLNLPPGEAARRREIALNLLKQNGVDPETLSEEQFNIFANQSPKYQQESLQMLVKYGAERLRVVHPTSSTAPAPTNDQTTQASQVEPEASTTATPANTKAKVNGTAASTAKPVAKPKQTRGNCDGCKTRKVKCSRKKPSCSECLEKGLECYYPPPRVRNNSGSAAEIAQDEPDEATQTVQEPEISDLGSPGFETTNQPSGDLMSPSDDQSDAYDHSSQSLYPQSTTGMAHYQSVAQPAVTSGTEMDYTQPSTHESYSYQSQAPPTSIYPDPVTAATSISLPATSADERSSSRRSLPSVPRSQKPTDYISTQNSNASWQALPNPVSTNQVNRASPDMSQQNTGKQGRNRKWAPAPTYESSQAYNGPQQAAALSQAAVQPPAQQSPVARNASPFQKTSQSSRAKSRQGHRSQQSSAKASTSLYSAPTTTESTSNNAYDSSSRYSTPSNQAATQASNRIAYEPYSQHPSAKSSSTYPSYDSTNSRSHATSSVSLSNPVTQSSSASYSTSTAPSTDSWSSSANRNAQSYNLNHSNTTSSSYNLPSTSTQQASTLQSFHVRPQSIAPQAKPSSSSYNQQPEQQQFYGSYSSQSHTSANPQPQDWYGFTSASNSSSNNYRSSSRNSGTSGYGQSSQNNSYQQQHGHIDGDQALYGLLRGNSGH